MKHIVPIIFGVMAVSTSALAQTAEIDKIVLAAPPQAKDAVMVIKWKPDFTYDTLRPASNNNKLVCYDISGYPGHPAFMLECTNVGNLARVAQNLKFEAMGDKKAVQAAFDAAEKDGTRVKPEFGSVWIHLMGPDQEHARRHTTIAVPGATAESLGMPDKPAQGGAWIMNAGTSTAHIMTPGS